MNDSVHNREAASKQREAPRWVTAKPSIKTWIGISVLYGVFRRRFEPELIDALGWSHSQYFAVLLAVCAVVFALGLLLDRWLKRRYGLSTPSRRRGPAETDPTASAIETTDTATPARRIARQR